MQCADGNRKAVRSQLDADRGGSRNKGPHHDHKPRLQRREHGLHRCHLCDHPAGVPLDLASRHSGGGHRVRYLHQPRHSLLYGNGPAVRCLHHHRHDSAGVHRGLRHPDDDEVPAGEDKGDCEERGGAHRPAGERQVDCRLRPDLLLRDLWRRSLFRHRHREFHVRFDGARRADLHDLRSVHASRIPDGV